VGRALGPTCCVLGVRFSHWAPPFSAVRGQDGKSTRIGVYKCYACRKPFRVTVNTVFESSHIPLRVWLQAVFLLASSKKGISSNQLSRMLVCCPADT
jgi:hypothetical protein